MIQVQEDTHHRRRSADGVVGVAKSAVLKLGVLWPGRRAPGARPVEPAEEPPGDEEGEPPGVHPAEGPSA